MMTFIAATGKWFLFWTAVMLAVSLLSANWMALSPALAVQSAAALALVVALIETVTAGK